MQTTIPPIAASDTVIAKSIGMSLAWVRKDRITNRILPFYRIGSAIRYDFDRVREALAVLEEGGTPAGKHRGAK